MPSLAELLDISAQWGRGVQNKISDLVSPEAWAQALRNPPRVLSQYQQMQPGQQQQTINEGIDAAMNFGPAVLGSLRNVAPKAIKDLMPTEYKSAMSIEPPHNVRDNKKLLLLVESMKNNGWQGRPILTYDVGRGKEALTGSHRIKAAREADIEVPIYEIKNVGDYVDKNGKSILDIGFMELEDQIKWLNKFGDKNAAKLLKQEPEF